MMSRGNVPAFSSLMMDPETEEWLRPRQILFNCSVENLPPLPRIFKVMASRASSNSLSDLRSLIDSLCNNNTLAEYPDLINIFFRYLEKDPPSNIITRTRQQIVQLCATALDGITTAVLCLRSTIMSGDAMILQKISRSWPSIWKWINYFHTYSDTTQPLPLSKPKLKKIVLRMIGHFFVIPPNPVSIVASATPGLSPLIADIWIWQSRRDPTRYDVQEHYRDDCLLATSFISTLITADPSIARFIVESLDGDVDKIASILLKYVRMAIEGGQEWICAFPLVVGASGLISEQVPGLMHALLSQHSIIDVTHAYATFSSIRTSHLQIAQLQTCLFTCLHYIFEGARTTDGFTWMVQAVRSRLLPSMLRSARWKCTLIDHDQKIVDSIKMLGSYLVYRSVLRAVLRSLQDSTISLLESQISSTSVKNIWEEFKAYVRKLQDVKAQFDAMGGKHLQKCSASECTVIDSGPENFRICSACHEAHYCSKLCQKRDWKEGHRAACESIRKFRAEGRSSQVSRRDASFMFTLLQDELYRMEYSLLHLRDETLSADPSAKGSFIVLLNYTSFPTSYGAFSPHSFSKFLDLLGTRGVKTQVIPMRPLSPLTPLKRKKSSTVVNIVMLIRYGARCNLIWGHPEIGSSLLGWDCQLPKEFEVIAASRAKGPAPTSLHEQMKKLALGGDSEAIKTETVEYAAMKALKSMRGVDAADSSFQSVMNQLMYQRDFGKDGVCGIVRP